MIRASQRNGTVVLIKSLTYLGKHGEGFPRARRFFLSFHIPNRQMAFATQKLIFRQVK